MTWSAFRNRGAILREVADAADLRRDGVLPWDLPGVSENFRDELDLVGALHLRWYTRLSGRIERRLIEQPLDLEAAARRAWVDTAEELPGIRAVLDRELEQPTTPAIADALAKAQTNEHAMLALMAGLSGVSERFDPRAVAAGARIEAAARSSYEPGLPVDATPVAASGPIDPVDPPAPATRVERVATGSAAFVARLKAVLAA